MAVLSSSTRSSQSSTGAPPSRPERPFGPTRLSIRTKLAVALVGAFALSVGGVERLLAWHDSRDEDEGRERLRVLAESSRTSFANGATIHTAPGQVVDILGPDRRVLASSDPSRIGDTRPLDAIPATCVPNDTRFFHERLEGVDVLTMVAPTDPDCRTFLAASANSIALRDHPEIAPTVMWTLAIALAVQVLAISLGLNILVVRPIREIVSIMRRVGHGELDLRVSERLIADEFNWLAWGFNSMTEDLRETRRVLEANVNERMVLADRLATLGELSSGLVHGIKNPLAGLSGALQALEHDFTDEATRTKVIGLMREQIQRVDSLLRDLQRFAQPSPPELKDVAVEDLLDRVWALVRQHRSAHLVRLTRSLEAQKTIRGDRAQLEQAFMNICVNACQAMPEGGSLDITSRDEPGFVAIVVSDSGPGIPEELRSKVFKPFFTTKARGTGLGLTIAAQIIRDHHGELNIDCPKTGGTRLNIKLPTGATA